MDIITDYASRKARASDMAEYIDTHRDPKKRPDIEKVHSNLSQCASYLVFHEYFTVDELRLVKAHTCKQHLLCPFCAMRRSGKFVAKNIPKVQQVINENRARIPALVTLTVKNGPNLQERFNHLRRAHRRLNRRRLDARAGKSQTEWAKVAGGITAYEFTKQDEGDWHPHIHALVMLDDFIDQEQLSQEWKEITGDSFIVDIRRIRGKPNAGGLDIASALLEVCKYSLKFHDMTLPDTWHAYQTLRTRRLVDSFGILRGVQVPDDLLDDPLEGLPYLERHYRYHQGKRSYDLVECRQSPGTPVPGEQPHSGTGSELVQKPVFSGFQKMPKAAAKPLIIAYRLQCELQDTGPPPAAV